MVKIGRPTTYTPEIADEICSLISKGKSLVKICEKLDLNYSVVMEWIKRNQSFTENYARARDEQADFLAEELLDISNDPTLAPEQKRIMVDTRKWIASKLKPKKYGDRIQQDITNNDPLRELNADQIRQYMDRLRSAEAGASEGTGEPEAGTVPPIH